MGKIVDYNLTEEISHGIYVSRLARDVARVLGHDEKMQYDMALAGMLHDIGKLRLTNYIYGEATAESPLMIEEMKYVRMHSLLSYDIVKSRGYNERVCETILYHHENMDGSGYPENLTGEDIPKAYTKVLGEKHSQRIDTLIWAIIRASKDKAEIAMEPEIYDAMMGLRSFMFEHVYVASEPQREEQKAIGIIEGLYQYYIAHPEAIPGNTNPNPTGEEVQLLTRDYIAGMSDRYAVAKYTELFVPAFWQK